MLDGCTPYPPEFRERYIRAGYWRSETIAQAIGSAAIANRDRIAVVDDRRQLTFSQLLDEAARFRACLSANGIVAGDRVIVQVPNRTEFASVALACFDLGAVPIMALPALRRAELEYLAELAAAKAIIIAAEYRGFNHAALACDLRRDVRSLETVFTVSPAAGCIDLTSAPEEAQPLGGTAGDPFDVVLFLLSGGTTGLPKLIPRTHADYLYNAREAARVSRLDSQSRILIALPAAHNFPLACPGLIGALLVGATSVFSQETRADELAATISREQVTHLPCVPTIAMGLLDLPKQHRNRLDSLKVITVGGQRLQEPTWRALRRMWPSLTVQQVFGMAEGLLCYTHLGDADDLASTTQGRPLSPADEVRIVDGNGRDVAADEIGELVCRGPYTIRGYYRADERNADAFTADGFYRSGDLVRRDSAGNLTVEGRLKDQINRGGEKISAEEIESHLVAHPSVSAAAVVAMPDAKLGERPCAFITLKSEGALTLDSMRDFLTQRGVARYKWPERLEIIATMPLTNVGKIKKADLRRDIEGRLAAESIAKPAALRESSAGAPKVI
jgi:2,3-dihydroxybenzoate-AMP ligase